MSITTHPKWNELTLENELAFFRADVCLGSPESYSLEEKAAICEGMAATNEAIEKAMRNDFQQMPPFAQDKMLDLLQRADPEHFPWWKDILVGAMPDSVDDLAKKESSPC